MKTTDYDISQLLSLEWLYTNELRGYASSSVSGAKTRKYHGLFVAPFNPPTERRVLVSKFEEHMAATNGIVTRPIIKELFVHSY